MVAGALDGQQVSGECGTRTGRTEIKLSAQATGVDRKRPMEMETINTYHLINKRSGILSSAFGPGQAPPPFGNGNCNDD